MHHTVWFACQAAYALAVAGNLDQDLIKVRQASHYHFLVQAVTDMSSKDLCKAAEGDPQWLIAECFRRLPHLTDTNLVATVRIICVAQLALSHSHSTCCMPSHAPLYFGASKHIQWNAIMGG